MRENFKLLVVTSIPFPIGLASTNRIISYSKGLVQLGNEVSVVTSNKEQSTGDAFQEYEGIKHRSFGISSKGIPAKILLIFSVLRMAVFLFRRVGRYDAALLVSNNMILIYLTC